MVKESEILKDAFLEYTMYVTSDDVTLASSILTKLAHD